MPQTSATAVLSQTSIAPATASVASGRIDQIDVLRGISILAVIVHHMNLRMPLNKTPLGRHLPAALTSDLGWNGYNGVIIFFAISGFLITSTCLRRWNTLSQISLPRFYRLRAARIAPMLLALLLVLSALHLLRVPYFTINPARSSLPRALFAALTLHVNWLEARHGYLPANWDVLWSLSNEEMFYLFFPVLCLLLKRRAALISALGLFILAGPLARTVFTHNSLWADYGYLSAMDAISMGCVAAIAADAIAFSPRNRRAMQWIGCALIVFVTGFRVEVGRIGVYRMGLDVTLLAAGTALACIAFLQNSLPGSWWLAPVRWFGRNSYEVYLTHMMVVFPVLAMAALFDQARLWAPLWYGLALCLAGALGGVIAHCYSEPMNRRLRRRWSAKAA